MDLLSTAASAYSDVLVASTDELGFELNATEGTQGGRQLLKSPGDTLDFRNKPPPQQSLKLRSSYFDQMNVALWIDVTSAPHWFAAENPTYPRLNVLSLAEHSNFP